MIVFRNDQQHFSQEFYGEQGGSTGRSGETLDGFLFDSSLPIRGFFDSARDDSPFEIRSRV